MASKDDHLQQDAGIEAAAAAATASASGGRTSGTSGTSGPGQSTTKKTTTGRTVMQEAAAARAAAASTSNAASFTFNMDGAGHGSGHSRPLYQRQPYSSHQRSAPHFRNHHQQQQLHHESQGHRYYSSGRRNPLPAYNNNGSTSGNSSSSSNSSPAAATTTAGGLSRKKITTVDDDEEDEAFNQRKRQVSSSSGTSTDSKDWCCVVCCQKVPSAARKQLYAIGPCDHPVCAVCSTKMRVLCDQDECPICRQNITKVLFTSNRDQKYADIRFNEIKLVNKEFLIYFENEEALKIFEELQMHPCRICKSNPPDGCTDVSIFNFPTLKQLDAHLRHDHELFLCDLCVDNLKIFSNERKYYTRKDLVRHKRIGDAEDTSYRGHPLCKFCDVRYMDDEDLHRHLRKDHYYCHFCDPIGMSQFFDTYHNLRHHYGKEHYLCEDGACREEKFTSVFRSEIDLQAHRLEQHCGTRNEAKEARILNIDFGLKPHHHLHHRSIGSAGGVGGTGSSSSQISSHNRPRRPAGLSRGAIGGLPLSDHEDDMEEGEEHNIPQELPKPEDFPILAPGKAAAMAAAALLIQNDPETKSGKEKAEQKGKGVPSRKQKQNPSFSSRISGSSTSTTGLLNRSEDEFPALKVKSSQASSLLCPSIPSSSSSSNHQHRKDLKTNAYATLSSVAAAVTSSVPKVVSKVAVATCLPATAAASCASGGAQASKTLSTQSLISSPAPSLGSTMEFPDLPGSKRSKKMNNSQTNQLQQQLYSKGSNRSGGTNASASCAIVERKDQGIRNPGFTGSSESFQLPQSSKKTSSSTTASSASKGKTSQHQQSNQQQTHPNSNERKGTTTKHRNKESGTGGKSEPSSSSSSSMTNGMKGNSKSESLSGSKSKQQPSKSEASGSRSGETGTGVKVKNDLAGIGQSLLKNHQEFPGLTPSSRTASGTASDKSGNKNQPAVTRKKNQQSYAGTASTLTGK